jgi:hypothetical protein
MVLEESDMTNGPSERESEWHSNNANEQNINNSKNK